jgi:hypothetical protein
VFQRHFVHEEEMLEQKGLHSSQNATGASLLLEDRVLHFLVEEEALIPRSVETALFALE